MASTSLSRTISSTGDEQKVTISAWVKRSGLSSSNDMRIVTAKTVANNQNWLSMDSDKLNFAHYNGSSYDYQFITNRIFRDTSAWYHIVAEVDTTQATESNRVKLYVNGTQVTSFSTENYPSLNHNTVWNTSGFTNYIGEGGSSNNYFDGQMAHVHLIDGLAYDADTFGETDSTTGIWKFKTPSVTYGTNGFFLKFENSAVFGTDSSGNANTFTTNGTMTQTIDTPSNVFATMNPLVISGSPTFANGNTTVATIGDNDSVVSNLGVSKMKFYYEAKLLQTYDGSGGGCNMGALREEQFNSSGFNSGTLTGFSAAYSKFYGNGNDGRLKEGVGTVVTSGLTRAVAGDIVMIACDPENNRVYAGINGTWLNSADPEAGTNFIGGTQATGSGNWFAYITSDLDKGNCNLNFGNGYFGTTAVASAQNPDDGIGIFEYDVPAGYRALCTKSINAQEYS